MPRKAAPVIEVMDTDEEAELQEEQLANNEKSDAEIADLNRMLATVLNYLSDDEVEEIDIEYLLNNTEGLRDWWDRYRESNRQLIEEEIKQSLSELTLTELEKIREQIKDR